MLAKHRCLVHLQLLDEVVWFYIFKRPFWRSPPILLPSCQLNSFQKVSRRDPPAPCMHGTGKRTHLLRKLAEFSFASAGEQQNGWIDDEEIDISFLKKTQTPEENRLSQRPALARTFLITLEHSVPATKPERRAGFLQPQKTPALAPVFLGGKSVSSWEAPADPPCWKAILWGAQTGRRPRHRNLDSGVFAKHGQFPSRRVKGSSSWHRHVASTDQRCSPPHLDVRRQKELRGLLDNVVYLIKSDQSPSYMDVGGS